MYSIATEALNYTNNVIIFTPAEKFKTFQIPYSTKNKQHKRLSITLASNLINKKFPSLINKFNSFEKKDDISDSINQFSTVWNSEEGEEEEEEASHPCKSVLNSELKREPSLSLSMRKEYIQN